MAGIFCFYCSPYGNRTRVSSVKGRCPRPLDERAMGFVSYETERKISAFFGIGKPELLFSSRIRGSGQTVPGNRQPGG